MATRYYNHNVTTTIASRVMISSLNTTAPTGVVYCRDVTPVTRYYEMVSYCYVAPILIILGLVGNFFNYVIFGEISRHNLGMYYMKTISLLDIVVCLLFLERPIEQAAIKYKWFLATAYGHVWFRIKVHFTLLNAVMKTSSLLLLLVCLERFFFIYHLRLHQAWCRSRWAKASPWLCFLVSLVVSAPQVLIYPVAYCLGRYTGEYKYDYLVVIHHPRLFMVYQIAKELFLTIIPCAIIFYLNYKLLIAFRVYYYSKGFNSGIDGGVGGNTQTNHKVASSPSIMDRRDVENNENNNNNSTMLAIPATRHNSRKDVELGRKDYSPNNRVDVVDNGRGGVKFNGTTGTVDDTINNTQLKVSSGSKVAPLSGPKHITDVHPSTDIKNNLIPAGTGDNRHKAEAVGLEKNKETTSTGGPVAQRMKGRGMLILLFSFVVSYALFILPISILVILYSFLLNNCTQEPCVYRILIYVFNTLELCNYCLSFYLYVAVDVKFREIFCEMICCESWIELASEI